MHNFCSLGVAHTCQKNWDRTARQWTINSSWQTYRRRISLSGKKSSQSQSGTKGINITLAQTTSSCQRRTIPIRPQVIIATPLILERTPRVTMPTIKVAAAVTTTIMVAVVAVVSKTITVATRQATVKKELALISPPSTTTYMRRRTSHRAELRALSHLTATSSIQAEKRVKIYDS